jgi:hypothetical protein
MLRAVLLIDLSGTNHLSLTAKYRGDSKGITFFIVLYVLQSTQLSTRRSSILRYAHEDKGENS